MEGGEPSEYCLEQLALFEAGHISATEMRDRWSVTRRKDARTDDHSSDILLLEARRDITVPSQISKCRVR